MAEITIAMPDGRDMAFALTLAAEREAAFVLSVRKSGSSLFSNLVSALCRHNGVATVDIPGRMFGRGYAYKDWNRHPDIQSVLWRGNVYVGFRDPPTAFFADPVFRAARKLLLVRDPRDVLVSEYFSNAYSHALPTEKADVSVLAGERRNALNSSLEAYVESRVQPLNNTVEGYRTLLDDPELKVLRYEDVIFNKDDWIRAIAAHFDLAAPDALIQNILGWADVRPAAEDPTAFVRKVAPGDHRDKLAPEAIARVNARLSDLWEALGYRIQED